VAEVGLPRRDAEARARLTDVAGRVRPLTLARDRSLIVSDPLGALLPSGGLQRGTVVSVEGTAGAGATSLAGALAAAATSAGEWAAVVDLRGTFGAEAAAESGVALERLAVVRRVPPERWATVVAALLDGITLVLAEVPRHTRASDVRRLLARARERDAVLVVLPAPGTRWSGDASLRIVGEGGAWTGIERGGGLLTARRMRVKVDGRGVAAREQVGELEGALARAV
jgi:hypothetical protein